MNVRLNGGVGMTITEILDIIHEERVELEVCQALQR